MSDPVSSRPTQPTTEGAPASPSPDEVFSYVQLIPLLLIVALFDVAVFRGKGYAGYAAMLGGAPLLMALAARRSRPNPSGPAM